MFSLKGFIKKGLLDAIGKQPTYWIILNAAGWMEKNVLEESDLADIQTAIDAYEKEQEEHQENKEEDEING